jgi:hypothetical protein
MTLVALVAIMSNTNRSSVRMRVLDQDAGVERAVQEERLLLVFRDRGARRAWARLSTPAARAAALQRGQVADVARRFRLLGHSPFCKPVVSLDALVLDHDRTA